MTGAELLVSCLEAEGIDTIFALPGEETNDLMDALDRSSIEIVICRHEQAAAFMASVHGRLTGQPAACLATLGPGATNLITGVADATMDLVPLIAITGQGSRDRMRRGRNSHQIIDLEKLFEPVTKSSVTLRRMEAIPGQVREALDCACSDRPGAVHLCLPEDLAGETTDHQAPLPARAERHVPYPNPSALATAVNTINDASKPIVLAGAGISRANAVEAFQDFVGQVRYPVATSFMAKGLLAPDDPSHLGAFGLPVDDHVDDATAAADLIIAVGLDPVEYPFAKLGDNGQKPVVQISTTRLPSNLGWDVRADVVGEIGASLAALGTSLADAKELWPEATNARAALMSDTNHALSELDRSPPSDRALVAALNQSLGPDDLILSGVGTHKLSLARQLAPRRPGHIVIANGLAGMGLALPGAIAASRLDRFSRVIAVCGDGDVMMNVQDMETATRLDLAMTVIVWVDGGFGLIEDKQQSETGARPDFGFASMDWAQLAGAFGWHHSACSTARDLADVLGTRTQTPRRHLITVPVRYDGSLA